jgi:hypothetical protein
VPKNFQLPDASLRALGRIAWAAINLEDWTNSNCELVLSEFDSRIPIGDHIDQAVKVARTWVHSPTTDSAIQWMLRSKELMQQWNQILHSVPVQILPDKHDAVVYFPKRDKQSGLRDAAVETSMHHDVLNAIADEFELHLDGWRDARMALNGAKRAQADVEGGEGHAAS